MELVRPDCREPLLLLNKVALKAIDDGALCVEFARPVGSAFSAQYAQYLWHMYNKGWQMECEYRGYTIPLFQFVRCGHCELCSSSRRYDIVKRAEIASYCYETPPYFFTLTYKDACLPPDGELQYRDVQLFFKRFRKLMTKYGYSPDVKYIVAGEYGHANGRPHYHVILYNNPLGASEMQPYKEKDLCWFLWRCWQKDEWYVFRQKKNFGQCYGNTASYVAKYIGKKSEHEMRELPSGRLVHPTFVRCSVGLGKKFYDENLDYYRNSDINEIEYLVPGSGMTKKSYMTTSQVRKFHPSPLQLLPSSVMTAYKSLVNSVQVLASLGYCSVRDAADFVKSVKLNVQYMPFISRDERYSIGYIGCPTSRKFLINKVLKFIKNDLKVMEAFGDLPEGLIDKFFSYKEKNKQLSSNELGNKIFRAKKDEAVLLQKQTL